MTERAKILIAADSGLRLQSAQDISDVVGACFDTSGLILQESDLAPAFFDLRSGLLGELFQKFTNYKLRLAMVLPDPKIHGERFSELAYEHRSHNLIRFFFSEAEAKTWLSSE
jgi:Domain of unknown function (DUF4180)